MLLNTNLAETTTMNEETRAQVQARVDALNEMLLKESRECDWRYDEDGTYWTGCDNGFQFTDEGWRQNGFRFCPYCGCRIVEQAA